MKSRVGQAGSGRVIGTEQSTGRHYRRCLVTVTLNSVHPEIWDTLHLPDLNMA